jgi:hypothetical protein
MTIERPVRSSAPVPVQATIDETLAPPTSAAVKQRALTEADAIEIWIARWLRVRPIDIAAKHGIDPRRLYPIWYGDAFPGSKGRAKAVYLERYPSAADRTDFGYRRIPRGKEIDPRQRRLFD